MHVFNGGVRIRFSKADGAITTPELQIGNVLNPISHIGNGG